MYFSISFNRFSSHLASIDIRNNANKNVGVVAAAVAAAAPGDHAADAPAVAVVVPPVLSHVVVDWSVELGLCAQLLDLDQRNFHCWSYRRFIAEHNPSSTLEAEMQFTRTKIDQNFSNYSAWHQRSLLLSKMHQGAELTTVLGREFELIQQAYYTEPEDQSAWVYHRWLVCKTLETESNAVICATLRGELKNCNELLEVEPNSKWAMLTSVFLLRQLLTHDKTASDDERVIARERVQRLRQLDPQRTHFYENELKSL